MNENTAKRRAALWVAVVFVLGLALGGVFGYFYGHRAVVIAGPPILSEPERRARRLDQLTHDLNLNDTQRQQIDALLLQIHNDFKSIHDKNAAQLDAEMNEARHKSREQIRAVLTPEQLPKFEELLRRLDEERKRNAANQPPPPGAPAPSSR
jgi:Spy/CpxP family protein refolding chaperone